MSLGVCNSEIVIMTVLLTVQHANHFTVRLHEHIVDKDTEFPDALVVVLHPLWFVSWCYQYLYNMASIGWLVNNELERKWKEAIFA
jgi:hypothetical protein